MLQGSEQKFNHILQLVLVLVHLALDAMWFCRTAIFKDCQDRLSQMGEVRVTSLYELISLIQGSYIFFLIQMDVFFNISLNLTIRSSWSQPQSAPSLVFFWLYRVSPSLAAKNILNLILVSTMWQCPCVVFSCVVGRGCLLWPVCSLGKTLFAYALLQSIFQGQICLLLQVFLDFLLLHSSPL